MEVACSGWINKILPCQQIDASPPWTPHQNPKLCSSQYLGFLQTVVEENTTLIHNSFPELHIFDAQSTCIWSPSLYFVIQQIQTRWFNKYKLNDSKKTNLVIQQIQTWWFNKYKVDHLSFTELATPPLCLIENLQRKFGLSLPWTSTMGMVMTENGTFLTSHWKPTMFFFSCLIPQS